MVRTPYRGGFRRTITPAIVVALLALLFPLLGAAQDDSTRALVPIGGGYNTETLQGFGRVVAETADGDIALIYVVPSTYGDSKDPETRQGNIELATERTEQVEDACAVVVVQLGLEMECVAELLMLFDRDEAEDEANSDPLYDEETDGVFILGGDQTLAMRVLADTPAEEALTDAYERGVVIGGTSAGAAVQSQNMIAGYPSAGWPYNALERPMVNIWWINDDETLRGLVLGSDEIIWDQHFYQRGRFTRLLNVVAQSDEQFGGASKLGVGVDNGTNVTLWDETLLSNVVGETSVTIIDGETANTSFEWIGERETLSARNVRTHVMAAGEQFSYDVPTRTPRLDGSDLPLDLPAGWDSSILHAPRNATLMLGGELTFVFDGSAMADFLSRVDAGKQIVIVSADSDPEEGQDLVDLYTEGLEEAGWTGGVESIVYGDSQWRGSIGDKMAKAGGVIFVAGDQARLASAINDDRFRALLNQSLNTAQVVLTDWAMTAAMGDWYVANSDASAGRQTMAIDAFKAGDADIQPGLGILDGAAFQPLLTLEQHWGRLYALTMAHPDTIAFGISEDTAIVLEPGNDAYLVGDRSVIALDGRAATYADGDNGAFTAFNVMLDAFAPGDTIVSNR